MGSRLNTVLLIILNIVTGIGFGIIVRVEQRVEKLDRDVAALIEKAGGIHR